MSNFRIIFHKDLTLDSWSQLSVYEIMGNIGSEVSRTLKWREKGKEKMWRDAFDRSLELFDLSKEIQTLPSSWKTEIHRSREVWCDFIVGDNQYKSSAENIQKYFDHFAIAARKSLA